MHNVANVTSPFIQTPISTSHSYRIARSAAKVHDLGGSGERVQVSCLSEGAVMDWLEHRMPTQRRAELEVHIDGCAACRRVLVELVSEWSMSSVANGHATLPKLPIKDGGRL